ncbi:putative spermidine/putrescine transport system permease protein [Rhodoligotrophos appendicifer]|uniref:ABC transporter permease n=1 Tax=Rhodoligotrophos appendicifer TaxID=987056 RepID=UPI0011858EF4|nr:ABC transporter permease [Rhodoligotrophos appendicifer]
MMARSWLLKSFVYLIFLLIVLPLLVVIGVSFNPTSRFIITPLTPSLTWYREFFSRAEYVNALFLVTLPLATISAVLATVIGTLTAIALSRLTLMGKSLLESIFMIPVLIPGILLGAALYLFFARLESNGSLFPLIIGHTLIGIPFVIRIVVAGLSGINPSIEEAAVNLGCNRVQAFWKVSLPLIRSSLVSGGVFAFILSFSDINVALFLSGPSTNTLPLHIFSDIQWQGDPTIAAASTIQIVVVTSLIIIANRLSRSRLVL